MDNREYLIDRQKSRVNTAQCSAPITCSGTLSAFRGEKNLNKDIASHCIEYMKSKRKCLNVNICIITSLCSMFLENPEDCLTITMFQSISSTLEISYPTVVTLPSPPSPSLSNYS